MAKPVQLQAGFGGGMVQDLPRHALPKGAVWNLQDFIPDYQASLRKRGGWTYGVSATTGGYMSTVGFAPFSTGTQIVMISAEATSSTSGTLWTRAVSAGVGTVTGISAASGVNLAAQMIFLNDKLWIPTRIGGGTGPSPGYYNGTAFTYTTSGVSLGRFGTVYKNRLVLGGEFGSNREKTYFSAASDMTTFNLTESWIATGYPTGYASLPAALLIFTATNTVRVRGSIPPPGSDFIVDDPIFNIGCSDARSIAVNGGYCIFANAGGVYRTNGSTAPEDLTAAAGLKKYWNDLLSGYVMPNFDSGGFPTWTLAGGFYRNYYIVTVMNGTSFVDALCFDVDRRIGYRLSNIPAACFVSSPSRQEELYFASRSQPRLGKLSSLWMPSASVKNDADGTPVTPVLETPFYFDTRSGKKTWRTLFMGYDMRDAAADNPTLTMSTCRTADGSYTALSPTLAETADYDYAKLRLGFPADGLGVKVQQTNASSETKVTMLLADVHLREGSRVT